MKRGLAGKQTLTHLFGRPKSRALKKPPPTLVNKWVKVFYCLFVVVCVFFVFVLFLFVCCYCFVCLFLFACFIFARLRFINIHPLIG